MDPPVHEISKRGIDHPLPLDTVPTAERCAFDAEPEVALACRIVAAMAAMLFAFIDELDVGR